MMNTPANSSKQVTVSLMTGLSARNKDVLTRRFGLKTGKKETLESIGRTYDITRERVRQIEEASLRQIRQGLMSGANGAVEPFVAFVRNIIGNHGGVISESALFEKYSGSGRETPQNAVLVLVLTLDGSFSRYLEDDNFRTFWSVSRERQDTFISETEDVIAALKANAIPVALTAITDLAPAARNEVNRDNIIAISKDIDRNVFGNVGLSDWPEIKPRGVRDKSFLVLKKEGNPKHFREIAALINAADFDGGKAHVQTVHNELIKDNRFVLVGRGIYGLAEWGYKSGTVKDIMVDLVKNSDKPLTKQDIVAHVLSHRMVKENTVLLNLQDSKTFKKGTDGTYTLHEA